MKWEGNRESDNVEDRRDGDDGGSGGGGGGFGFGGRSIGLGSIAIVLVASYFFGVSPMTVLNLLSGGSGQNAPLQQSQPRTAHRPPANDQMAKFVSTVLADTEDTWTELFRENGARYVRPK
ncbi:MAG: neutral zinc metallopeptidase, partial [Nitrosomonadales bacterium]|nr:neutral zinc metallopeptidase [Nitrosomonadales bacterium]